MALPPNVFTVVAAGLKKNCYSEKGHNRIVIEKPFGKDLESCQEMMGELKKLWKEEETFREWETGGRQGRKRRGLLIVLLCCARRHRPLLGQGDGQEHPPHALRQPLC